MKKVFKIVLFVLLLLFFPYFFDKIIMNRFITSWDLNDWASFLGAYIGGFITLFGIWWQVTREEKQKEKAAIAKNQLTTEELINLLRVNGVSDIELFKENITYLKDVYSQKSKIFKVLYNKEPEISENDYVNSILNQFYMGKIENEPADITGFEEDYPKISINLKK